MTSHAECVHVYLPRGDETKEKRWQTYCDKTAKKGEKVPLVTKPVVDPEGRGVKHNQGVEKKETSEKVEIPE